MSDFLPVFFFLKKKALNFIIRLNSHPMLFLLDYHKSIKRRTVNIQLTNIY